MADTFLSVYLPQILLIYSISHISANTCRTIPCAVKAVKSRHMLTRLSSSFQLREIVLCRRKVCFLHLQDHHGSPGAVFCPKYVASVLLCSVKQVMFSISAGHFYRQVFPSHSTSGSTLHLSRRGNQHASSFFLLLPPLVFLFSKPSIKHGALP